MDSPSKHRLRNIYAYTNHELTGDHCRPSPIFYLEFKVHPEHLEVYLVYWLHVWQPREGVGVINNPVDDGGVSSGPTTRVDIKCCIVFNISLIEPILGIGDRQKVGNQGDHGHHLPNLAGHSWGAESFGGVSPGKWFQLEC